MKNKSVSDFVAAAMDAALKSDEHKSLFNTQYKYASAEDENDAKDKCSKCDKKHDECKCGDSMMADDNDAKKKKDSEDSKDSKDSSSADDQEEMSSAAFDVAIDSLLTASAALDSVGLSRGSAFSLKLASLVVEAKKKDAAKDKEKEKAAKEKAKEKAAKEKEKAKRDSQAAKDKVAKEKAKEKEKASKEKEKASKEKEKASKKSGDSSKK